MVIANVNLDLVSMVTGSMATLGVRACECLRPGRGEGERAWGIMGKGVKGRERGGLWVKGEGRERVGLWVKGRERGGLWVKGW